MVTPRTLLLGLDERVRACDPRRLLWMLGAVYSAVAAAGAARAPGEWIVLLLLVAGGTFVLAGATAVHGRSTLGLGRILAASVAFRLLFVFLAPTLSDDLWRYLWDGKVARAGINPYAFAPDATELVALRDSGWQRVNHPSIPTIYPPVAQMLFRVAVGAGGLAAWKVMVIAFDLLTISALARGLRLSGERIEGLVFYAWNPLILVEYAWNAHVDAAAVALVTWAVVASSHGRRRCATTLVTLAAGIKVFPALLLPSVMPVSHVRRMWWVPVAIAAAFTAPYLSAGWPTLLAALGVYLRDWEFNGFIYETMRCVWNDRRAVRVTLLGAVLAAALFTTARVRSPADAALWIVMCLVLLNPTVHPWYVTWLVPLAVLATRPPRVTALLSSLVVPISYVVLVAREATGVWSLPRLWLHLEWWPVLAMFGLELAWAARSRARGLSALRG